ncbi:uncharacterized protein DFL_006532 [Arthrobotrys flagrans]|uniref:G domain-containing protein n=1 Tax=Arthrobotrys flagrans TaxID=97331 RepID=A0A436ZTL5_ARTFL|nr:hypothetical protein DFL_006532 [Arthrobotrys flagrans]
MTVTLVRPALGQTAALGDLYDARSDMFISLSLFKDPPPTAAIKETDNHSSDIKVNKSETYRQKLKNLSLSAELSASFLAGMVTVEGSGSYLNDTRESNRVMETSLYYNITTVHEKVNFSASELSKYLALDNLRTNLATHVVAEIGWGAQSIVTARYTLSENEEKSKIEGRFKLEFEKMKGIKIGGEAGATIGNTSNITEDKFQVTVHGDVLADDGNLPTDFAGACQFISNVPKYIKSANNGKGKALTYKLLPIDWLGNIYNMEIAANGIVKQLDAECLEKFIDLFDDVGNVQRVLNDYHAYISNRRSYVPDDHSDEVTAARQRVRIADANLKSGYAKILKEVRAGEADSQKLWELYNTFTKGDSAVKDLVVVTKKYPLLKFIDEVVALGARYIGYNGLLVENEIAKMQHEDTYVFYFNRSVQQDSASWTGNLNLVHTLLQDTEAQKLVFVVDCDAKKVELEKSKLVQYRGQNIVVEDVLEQQTLLRKSCLVRYNPQTLDRTMPQKPIDRRAIRIPCPGINCDSSMLCDWICFQCQAPIEYGPSDDYIYCNCGRGRDIDYSFWCSHPKHGSSFTPYNKERLSPLLRALEPFPELNILILGETGVGKSTFINAFLNYILFDGLSEALKADPINYLVPCSFATQYVDTSDPRWPLVQKEIKIGSSKDEHDGSGGQSATQKTTVYSFRLDDINVRLIDTPGIGDTRGVEQDRKNMADILSTLANYSKLHGILILLKPNNSRLTVVFKFCINELLTHLHRNAEANMVFGFTNTRGSNYQPGDTFMPLNNLLKEHKDTKLGLFRATVYCFDSESFRYLAAHKRGVDMGSRDDYSRSWAKSVEESQRLMRHFRSLTPHQVKGTLSLNESRRVISRLTKPMAEIAQVIKASVAVNEDRTRDLSEKELDRGALEQKLLVEKIVLTASPLDMPRTVCGNTNCIEVADVHENDRGVKKTIYKTFCHNPCYLQNVRPDTVNDPELRSCSAFGGTGSNCRKCGHLWYEHLHIMYELRETLVEMKDPRIEQALKESLNDIDLKRMAIEQKDKTIAEFKDEHKQIQEAAVHFSIFLERNSITPYNDSMLEYLDLLIKEEKAKVAVGGRQDRLSRLEEDRKRYQELIQLFTSNIKQVDGYTVLDEKGVDKKIEDLFNLPHYGQMLKEAVDVVDTTHTNTYREQSYSVIPKKKKKRSWW